MKAVVLEPVPYTLADSHTSTRQKRRSNGCVRWEIPDSVVIAVAHEPVRQSYVSDGGVGAAYGTQLEVLGHALPRRCDPVGRDPIVVVDKTKYVIPRFIESTLAGI